MAPSQSPTARGNAKPTRIPTPAQSLDWSKRVTPRWEGALAYKKRAVSELDTVNNAIDLMAQEAATLPDSKTKTLFTTQLALVQPIVEAQLTTRRDEEEQTQKIVELLKAKSIVPKTAEGQRGVLMQLMQVLNGSDIDMTVGDLLEQLQRNLITAQDPLPGNEKAVTGPRSTKIAEVAPRKQAVTKSATSNASSHRKEAPTAATEAPKKPRAAPTKPAVVAKRVEAKPKPKTTRVTEKKAVGTAARPLKDTTNHKPEPNQAELTKAVASKAVAPKVTAPKAAAPQVAAPKVQVAPRPMAWVKTGAEANKNIKLRKVLVNKTAPKKATPASEPKLKRKQPAKKAIGGTITNKELDSLFKEDDKTETADKVEATDKIKTADQPAEKDVGSTITGDDLDSLQDEDDKIEPADKVEAADKIKTANQPAKEAIDGTITDDDLDSLFNDEDDKTETADQPEKKAIEGDDELDSLFNDDDDDDKIEPADKKAQLTHQALAVESQDGSEEQVPAPDASAAFVKDEVLTTSEARKDTSIVVEGGRAELSPSKDTTGTASDNVVKATPEPESNEPERDASRTTSDGSDEDDSNSPVPPSEVTGKKGYLGLRKEGQKGVATKVVASKKKRPQKETTEDPYDIIEDDEESKRAHVPRNRATKKRKSAEIIVDSDDESDSASSKDKIATPAEKKRKQAKQAETSEVSRDKQALYLQEAGVDVGNIIFESRRRSSAGGSAPRNLHGAKRKRFLGDDGPAPSKRLLVGRNIAIPRTRRLAPTAEADMMDLDSTPARAAPLATMSVFNRPRMVMPTSFDPDEEL